MNDFQEYKNPLDLQNSVPQQQQVPQNVPVQNVQPVPQQYSFAQADEKKKDVSRIKGILQFVFGFIEVALIIRFILLLLGARTSDFSLLMFQLTDPLVLPFKGTFTAPGGTASYFDTAAILAMIIYALVSLGIKELMDVLVNSK